MYYGAGTVCTNISGYAHVKPHVIQFLDFGKCECECECETLFEWNGK